jgi:hypothetical protein
VTGILINRTGQSEGIAASDGNLPVTVPIEAKGSPGSARLRFEINGVLIVRAASELR